MSTYQDVLDAAEALSVSDRLRLAEAIWEKLPESEWPRPSDEWIAEVQRRSREYDEGRMSASTWPEVRDRARRKAGLDE